MTIEIVPAGPDRVDALAGLLARAFLDDPQIRWPLPSDDLERTSTEMFRLLVEGYTDLGFVWRAAGGDGGSIGCAAWLPPGRSDELARLNLETAPGIDELTDDGGARYHAMWDWIESQVPSEPVWFLDMIGVDASARGAGVGGELIRIGLEGARADGVRAWLETGNAANIPMYEHLGFRVIHDGDVPGGGPHIWFLQT